MTLEEQENPYLAVDVVIAYRDGVVLVQRGGGWWALPGGFVEWGETVEAAARREVEEETGLSLEEVELFDVYSDPERDSRGHVVSVVFTATGSGMLQAGSDAVDTDVFPLEEAAAMNLAFDHAEILAAYRI